MLIEILWNHILVTFYQLCVIQWKLASFIPTHTASLVSVLQTKPVCLNMMGHEGTAKTRQSIIAYWLLADRWWTICYGWAVNHLRALRLSIVPDDPFKNSQHNYHNTKRHMTDVKPLYSYFRFMSVEIIALHMATGDSLGLEWWLSCARLRYFGPSV